MNSFDERLFSRFQSLPPGEQSALEILSVVYQPVSRTRALQFVSQAGIVGPSGTRFSSPEWMTVVHRLVREDLLVEEGKQIACNPDIIEAVTRAAGHGGRLSRWVDVANELMPERRYRSNRLYLYYYKSSDLEEDLRIAIHLNQTDRFMMLVEKLYKSHEVVLSPAELFQRFFDNPFNEDWLASRSPEIRDTAISVLIQQALAVLEPADGPVALLQKIVARETDWTWRRQLLVRHQLMRGDLPAAQELILRDGTAAANLLDGWQLCIRGEYERSVEQFETAIKLIKKESRRRVVVISPESGALFVIALIGTGDANRLRQAHKYLDVARRKDPDKELLYTGLKNAADLVDGKLRPSRKVDSKRAFVYAEPSLQRLVVYTALCWEDRDAARSVLPEILDLHQAAVHGGYQWVAAECTQLLGRLRPGGDETRLARQQHEALGTAPMLNAIREEHPWERGLAALERMVDRVGTVSPPRGATSRMTWRIEVNRHSSSVDPYEQKLSPAGKWSKGKLTSLKKLHSRTNVEFMTLQDEHVCQAVEAVPLGSSSRLTYEMNADKALAALVGHPLVFRSDSPSTRIEVSRAEPNLRVTTKGGKVRIELVPKPPRNGTVVAQFAAPTQLTVTVFGPEHGEIFAVLGTAGLVAPASAKDKVVRAVSAVSALLPVHSDIGGEDTDAEEIDADSTPHFHLTPYEDGLRVEPLVRPFPGEGPTYIPGKGGEVVFATVGGRKSRAQRNIAEEARRHDEAVSSCPSLRKAVVDGNGWTLNDPYDCLEFLDELHALGNSVLVAWPKGETMRIQHRATFESLSLKIRRKQDWFGIDGELKLDSGLVMGLRELLERVEEAQGRFIQLGDQGFIALTDRFRRRVQELAAYIDRHGKGLRFHQARTPALEALVEEAGSVDTDDTWTSRIRQFREAQSLDPTVPSTLRAELRDYQAQGFRWAARLAAWGAGACLADDMGLGKTVQALTVALARAPAGPTLVVAPTSVCPNWIDEARRFTPTLNPVVFGYGDREESLQSAGPYDLIVCSYGLLHQEADRIETVEWETIVLDEAQAIKNRNTMRSRAAMRLRGTFRMITTGTPIENHLGELWNLFNFINPGLLGSSESFNAKFATPIHQQGSSEARGQLKRLIQPFILRRTKTAVLDELPARTEITIRVEMTEPERAFYEAVRQRAMDALGDQNSENGKSHLQILAEIMKLRRSCCHPRLVVPEVDIPGSKLEAFAETVVELMDNGHKALVFSQFVDHLRIVQSRLDQMGISYRYLDGGTRPAVRKREIDAFQAGNGDLFLISLRAGGQGLNLTAADYVIHLDPWWNPAVEDQASDRAHRIGQTRPVTIYRLVMKDTIEEKIVDLHAEKRDLADNLLEGADMSGKMSADELLTLIRGV